MDEDPFKRRTVNQRKLLDFGFVQQAETCFYETGIVDGSFRMAVTVLPDGKVKTCVTDAVTGDEYVLHRVAGACGEFVGKIRDEHDHLLKKIAERCFEPEVFKSKGAKQIIRYIAETWRDEPKFLWDKFPDNAIFRRKDNAKWYAALLTVSRKKLMPDAADDPVEIVDMRIAPESMESVVDGNRYFPGWHMNKKHWITVILDGSVPWNELRLRLENSYLLAKKS